MASSAGTRPASRAASRATTGRLATAKKAESARSPSRPKPRCATTQASRKWSGAPPRSSSTTWNSSSSGWRPTKSGSVSSSCGGQASSWWKRKPAAAAASSATPSPNQWARDPGARGGTLSGPETLCLCGIAHRLPSIVAASLRRHADLRVPLPRRAYLRGLPEDGRRADRDVRSVRQEPRSRRCSTRSRCTSRAPASTRPTTAAAAARRRSLEGGGSGDSGASEKKSDSDSGAGEKKAAAAD